MSKVMFLSICAGRKFAELQKAAGGKKTEDAGGDKDKGKKEKKEKQPQPEKPKVRITIILKQIRDGKYTIILKRIKSKNTIILRKCVISTLTSNQC